MHAGELPSVPSFTEIYLYPLGGSSFLISCCNSGPWTAFALTFSLWLVSLSTALVRQAAFPCLAA